MNKTYAVSDLHGRYDLWEKIKGHLDSTDTIYVLGDVTDRGPDGWKLLKELLENPQVRYIKGNHDQMMIDCWREDFSDTYLWFCNGGYTTYSQMALDNEHTINIYLAELDKKPYRNTYINKLRQAIYLSHAGFTPGVRETDDPHQYIWDRDHVYDEVSFEKDVFVVHGHTPLKYLSGIYGTPNDERTILWYADGHKIDIDNGCFRTGKIAILDLDTWETHTFEVER